MIEVSEETQEGRSREEILMLFASMLGAGLLARAAGSEPWVGEIESAFLSQLG
ncbi:hypothetical protein ABZQ63_34170 [Pseudomonas aeruginosa]